MWILCMPKWDPYAVATTTVRGTEISVDERLCTRWIVHTHSYYNIGLVGIRKMNYILCVINYFLVADVYLIYVAFFFYSFAVVQVIIVIKRVLYAPMMNQRMHRTLDWILSVKHKQQQKSTISIRVERKHWNEMLIRTYYIERENKKMVQQINRWVALGMHQSSAVHRYDVRYKII